MSPDHYCPRSILKSDSFDHGHDEGISSDDDSTSEEYLGRKAHKENESGSSNNKVKSIASHLATTLNFDRPSPMASRKSSKGTTSDETTDESSGGREIQNIIGRELTKKKMKER